MCATANAVALPRQYLAGVEAWARRIETTLERTVQCADQGMGHLEQQLTVGTQELQRQALERAAQAKADATPPRCSVCGRPLTRKQRDHQRTVATRFGQVKIRRTRGWCARCKQWRFPADTALGLGEASTASPALQEAAALLVAQRPVTEAAAILQRLTGIKCSPSTLEREARRQGQRAREQREDLNAALQDWEQLVQQAPSRWHWVYGATCFRLDQRGKTAGGRTLISERGYVMTRGGVEALRELLWAEAVRRGLLQAAQVLVVADGAVWIWNLVVDRFADAHQLLDYYHASQHLWTVAEALYGEGTAQARAWVEPLLKQLRGGPAAKVIGRWEEWRVPTDVPAAETVARERQYFQTHWDRLDYASATAQGWPLGSGAMESSCRQYQCRFKRPGQFWTAAGDEALLALHDFWRNGRWQQLFPHVRCTDPSLN